MIENSNNEKFCTEAGILDNALVMIAVLEKKGRIVSWNHAAETITGYSKEEAIGNVEIWKKLYPDKEYRDSVTKRIQEILSQKNYFENFETIIRTRSGESRTMVWNTKLIFERGLPRTITVGMDVTMEREANAFRESIIDNAYVLITVLDPKGRVQVWNKAAEVITGYPASEVIGQKDIWKKLYPDAGYRHVITKKISTIISEHNYFENLETKIFTKNQEQRIISWNTRQIEFGGITHEIAIGRDITEQRKAEKALVAYMTEMTMRLKQPVGIIRATLLEAVELIRQGMLTQDEIIVLLETQARNAAQIQANIQEFQAAVVEGNQSIPELYRNFLEG
ncbi:PAS domain S-box protein [bacterium]|nr:MAG: PAS domain S-box protein [bacterium]